VRVVVAEDIMLTREEIARLLRDAGVEVVAEAEDGENRAMPCGSYKIIPNGPGICSRNGCSTSPRWSTPSGGSWTGKRSSTRRFVARLLGLVAGGMSNRAIATRLFVTERTVEAHVTQILLKLGLAESPDQHRRVLAVLTYLRA
jgi:DNA-binding NarL/FixJ family response regulator